MIKTKFVTMNIRQLLSISFSFFFAIQVIAQTEFDIHPFRTANGDSYIDVVIDIAGADCSFEKSSEGWKSRTIVTVTAETDGKIQSFKKSILESPVITDSTEAVTSNQLHLERLPVSPGSYKVTVSLDSNSQIQQSKNVEIALPGEPEVSSVLLVEAYANSDDSNNSKFYRSGFDMLPMVGATIAPHASKLRFYTEMYNINEVVGEDSLYLVVFGLTDENGTLDPQNTRYKRIQAHGVNPLFETLPITAITPPQDGGSLLIQVKNRDGHLITESSTPVKRWRMESNQDGGDNVSFAQSFTDRDILYRHLEDHLPLASPSQQHTIQGVLKETLDIKILQGYLEQFWIKKSPLDPVGAWMDYASEVMVVDSVFGGCRSGHGADTDMGYVYLKYGRPNTVVKRHHDTDYYPYEIWHYHHTNGFSNRRFLFFAPHVVLECMEILQSDMPGEIQNEDWIQLLRSRENRVKVIDTQLNRLNPRD
ncbi:MAG: hypothetical protein CL823_01605, partial [Crocinitomicaceae bacterium]|nr:hypothetical protein [Crocinitomicaceae bacterium]